VYEYRKWTAEQRELAIAQRKACGYPWHGPPHPEAPGEYRIVTGTCYEHRPVLGSIERLAWFEGELLRQLKELRMICSAWVVLPNHYHVLVRIDEMAVFSRALGKLHGRTSFEFNRQDDARGRRVWHRSQDRVMRSESHFYTTLNYIHNNPVKHGCVAKWTEWPFSSVHWYLETRGREWMVDVWRSYPVLNYGEKWDL
jgi:putative transposase